MKSVSKLPIGYTKRHEKVYLNYKSVTLNVARKPIDMEFSEAVL